MPVPSDPTRPSLGPAAPAGGPGRAPAGNGIPSGPPEVVVVESCTTTWAFDTGRKRFARVPRGLALSVSSAEWRPYASMSVDEAAGTLVVTLDADATKLLRAEVHTGAGPCPACGARRRADPSPRG